MTLKSFDFPLANAMRQRAARASCRLRTATLERSSMLLGTPEGRNASSSHFAASSLVERHQRYCRQTRTASRPSRVSLYRVSFDQAKLVRWAARLSESGVPLQSTSNRRLAQVPSSPRLGPHRHPRRYPRMPCISTLLPAATRRSITKPQFAR